MAGTLIAERCFAATGKPLLLVDQAGEGAAIRMPGGSLVLAGEGRVVECVGEGKKTILVDWEPSGAGGMGGKISHGDRETEGI